MYEFLDCVTSYTELLRENKLGDVDCSGDKKIWRIVTPRLLYKKSKTSISTLNSWKFGVLFIVGLLVYLLKFLKCMPFTS